MNCENATEGNQWVDSRSSEEVIRAQENDNIIKMVRQMKINSENKSSWESISVLSKSLNHTGHSGTSLK